MQSLQKQIQQQEKIVKTLEKALADSKKEYADNAEVQDKWEEKLNKARAALADMQNALGDCEEGLSKFNDSMKETADSSGEAMQTVVSFNDAMKSIGNIAGTIGGALGGIFENTVDTMRDMVEEMFNLMSLAWSAASDWKDIQAVWGGSLEDIEKVYKGMELQGIGADTVTGAMQKLTANIHKGGDDVEAAMKELGFTESQFTSHFDMFKAIMDELSNHTRSDTERYNLASALFGEKKGSDVLLMLDKWKTGLNQYKKDFEETGLALSSPEIDALELVSQKIQEVQSLWDGIKTNIGAKLSEILNMDQLSEDTLNILRTIGSILTGTGDRKELVVKLEGDIEKLIGDITDGLQNAGGTLKELGDSLSESNNPLVAFMGRILSSLGDILDWLATNGKTITDFLEQALPWVLKNKILEATTGEGIGGWAKIFMDLGLDIATLTMMGKALGGGAKAGLLADGATATTLGGGIGAALLAKIPGLSSFLINAGAGVAGQVPFVDWFLNQTNLGRSLSGKQSWEETGDEYKKYFDHTFSEENWNDFLDNWNPNSPNANPIARLFRTGEPETFSDEHLMTPTDLAPVAEEIPETEEWVELPEAIYSLEDAVNAIQDWWDAYRNAENGIDSWEEEANAFNFMQEVLGDQFGSFWDTFLEKTDGGDFSKMEDIPADWFANISAALKNLSNDKYKGENDEDLPGKIGTAVAGAVKSQPININVYVDGEVVTQSVNRNLGSLMQSGLFG
jgi:ABC-type transporter Mla subunit MlaD